MDRTIASSAFVCYVLSMTRFSEGALREMVKDAVEAEKLRPFARRAGVGVGAVRSFLDGRDSSLSSVLGLSAAVGVELYTSPSRPGVAVEPADPEDFARIPVHEAELAAGAGAENHDEALIGHLAFRRDWLRRIGVSASTSVLARARGASMAPTIHDGDLVLIDRARNEPPSRPRGPSDKRPARIFALLDDGAARVKRIDFASPGTLAILSDNPDCPAEFRPASALSIIGRVVWWGHTNRE